ncbi:hypothetical protein ES702_07225 [subsurface metagenome]
MVNITDIFAWIKMNWEFLAVIGSMVALLSTGVWLTTRGLSTE